MVFSFRFVQSPGSVGFEHALYLVPHAAEHLHLFLVTAHGVRGIVEAPMIAIHLAGKCRARLIGVTANCDDRLDGLPKKVVHVLGSVCGDVDADFGERFDGERVNVSRGFTPGASDFKPTFAGVAKNAFRHVAAAGVSGAENENERLIILHLKSCSGAAFGLFESR